jgi:hypothetical protein
MMCVEIGGVHGIVLGESYFPPEGFATHPSIRKTAAPALGSRLVAISETWNY